jgi:hypothetical protein
MLEIIIAISGVVVKRDLASPFVAGVATIAGDGDAADGLQKAFGFQGVYDQGFRLGSEVANA